MSVRRTSAVIIDQAEPEKEGTPPPEDDGDIATPKTEAPSDDDRPLD